MEITKAQARKIIRNIIDAYASGYDNDTLVFMLQNALKEISNEPAKSS